MEQAYTGPLTRRMRLPTRFFPAPPLAGTAGALPALSVPVASADVTEVAAVPMPGAAPTVLAILNRTIDSLAQGIHHQRMEVDAPSCAWVPRRRLRGSAWALRVCSRSVTRRRCA